MGASFLVCLPSSLSKDNEELSPSPMPKFIVIFFLRLDLFLFSLNSPGSLLSKI